MCLCTRSYLSTSQQDIAVLFYIAFIDLFLQEQATLNRSKHCFCIVFACWALYCRSELASVDSFVVSTDRRDLFMPLILYAASLKARATNHRDCTAFDRVSHCKAPIHSFEWQQPASHFPVSIAMKLVSLHIIDSFHVGIFACIMNL